jgi:AraC-like DNA-binding protein
VPLADAVQALDRALVALLPDTVPEGVELAARAVRLLEQDRTLPRVDALAQALGASVRTVQRLFADHVGVGPSWVARRFRLHEVALAATRGEDVDWAALAAELGYCDQAHLVRDFTATVGTPPARYASAR